MANWTQPQWEEEFGPLNLADSLPSASLEGIAQVRLFSKLGRPLSYAIPQGQDVQVGMLVQVPLKAKIQLGIVCALISLEEANASLAAPVRLRPLSNSLYPYPVLQPVLLDLALWMERYYACPLEIIFQAMVPQFIRQGPQEKTIPYLRLGPVTLTAEVEEVLRRRAPAQWRLYQAVRDAAAPVDRTSILRQLGLPLSVCKSLTHKGFLEGFSQVQIRHTTAQAYGMGVSVQESALTLTASQSEALAPIREAVGLGQFQCFLLHGVTGSGKTQVYLEAIQTALEERGSVLFLVPEIALAPQVLGRIEAFFKSKGWECVLWHSQLPEGQRVDAYHAVASGRVRIVVGARSALFAPLHQLRLIIVDEEHEAAYKQEESPRYHGRDSAVYLARLCGAVCVLGSATPSLESFRNSQLGRYRLLRLPERIDGRQLPTVHVADMRREIKGDKTAVFSRLLWEKMQDRLDKKEQTILFLNRRGFAPSVFCLGCELSLPCPNCSVTLTYHRNGERLLCHLCHYTQAAPKQCPACGTAQLRWMGVGTQRIEALLAQRLPQARLARVDADSLGLKGGFAQTLGAFRAGKIDILIGTQLIAKGLDFPNVTLVGLLDADLSLHIPDFRASERTFQLLVQVSGRAGRGDRAGEVVVQTFAPHSGPIQYARRGDFDGFLQEELNQRQEFFYPPFRHLVRHLFKGLDAAQVAAVAQQWADRLAAQNIPGVEIRGPAPAPLERIKGAYRFHTWYFAEKIRPLLQALEALRKEGTLHKGGVSEVLDVDAVQVL